MWWLSFFPFLWHLSVKINIWNINQSHFFDRLTPDSFGNLVNVFFSSYWPTHVLNLECALFFFIHLKYGTSSFAFSRKLLNQPKIKITFLLLFIVDKTVRWKGATKDVLSTRITAKKKQFLVISPVLLNNSHFFANKFISFTNRFS